MNLYYKIQADYQYIVYNCTKYQRHAIYSEGQNDPLIINFFLEKTLEKNILNDLNGFNRVEVDKLFNVYCC